MLMRCERQAGTPAATASRTFDLGLESHPTPFTHVIIERYFQFRSTARSTSANAAASRRENRSVGPRARTKLSNAPVGHPKRQYACGTKNEATRPTTATPIVATPAERTT